MHSPRCRLDHRRDLPSSLNHSKNYGVLLNTVKYIRNIKQKPLHKAYWESYKKFNCFDLQGDGVLCTAPTGLRLETAIGYFHFPNMREEGIPDLHFSKRSLLHSIVSANCTLADFFFFKRYYNNVIEEKSATGSNFSKYTKKHWSKLEGLPVFSTGLRTRCTLHLYSRCLNVPSHNRAGPIRCNAAWSMGLIPGFFLWELPNLSLASESAHRWVHNFTLFVSLHTANSEASK